MLKLKHLFAAFILLLPGKQWDNYCVVCESTVSSWGVGLTTEPEEAGASLG